MQRGCSDLMRRSDDKSGLIVGSEFVRKETALDEQRQQRIVITHTGSLPRPPELSALLFSNKPDEAAEWTRATRQAVADIVARQQELGIDVISDGEQSKVSFQVYALDRLTGLEPIQPLPGVRRTRENTAFPAFYRGGVHPGSAQAGFGCTGPIAGRPDRQPPALGVRRQAEPATVPSAPRTGSARQGRDAPRGWRRSGAPVDAVAQRRHDASRPPG